MDCPNEKGVEKRVEKRKRGTWGLIEQTGGNFPLQMMN